MHDHKAAFTKDMAVLRATLDANKGTVMIDLETGRINTNTKPLFRLTNHDNAGNTRRCIRNIHRWSELLTTKL